MPIYWISSSHCPSKSTRYRFLDACIDIDIRCSGFDTQVGGKGSQLSGGQKRESLILLLHVRLSHG